MNIKTTLFSVMLAGVLTLLLPAAPLKAEGAVTSRDNVIAEGVYIGEIDVSGMTETEAKAAVDAYMADLVKEEIRVRVNKDSVTVGLDELGLQWINRDVAGEAAVLGKTGNLIRRYKDLTSLKYENHVFDIEMILDDVKLSNFVEEELTAFDQAVVEPSLERTGGQFVVTESATGIGVNVTETNDAIRDAVINAEELRGLTVDAVCEVTEPKHDSSELESVQDVLATYSTHYNAGDQSRTKSLETSARNLNGTLMYPGDTISVSTLMGERSAENGYGSASGFEGTRTVDMVGAGICQTASTLYCASLYAELDVVERSNHIKVVNYVPYSMDATIYGGNDYKNPLTDLKLHNGFKYPVYIEASASGGTCTFTIYGKETNPGRKVDFISTTLEEVYPTEIKYVEDPSQPPGYAVQSQGAYPRVKATLTKVVTENGVEVERSLVHTDRYQMANAEWVVGVGTPIDQPPVEGEVPPEGQPVEGQPPEGQPVEGQPPEGQPVEGQPPEGQPVEGQPPEGQPVEGQQ